MTSLSRYTIVCKRVCTVPGGTGPWLSVSSRLLLAVEDTYVPYQVVQQRLRTGQECFGEAFNQYAAIGLQLPIRRGWASSCVGWDRRGALVHVCIHLGNSRLVGVFAQFPSNQQAFHSSS